ncbi:MAG TPA: hypothetical protein VKB05_21245 [Pyrinomonadaceae bacterium]|nr:hypothetical protein [Pyrinomonadaceae bacterium]
MRNKFKVAVLIALVLSAITAQAEIFYEHRVDIPFAPAKVPDGVTWSPSLSLKEGGLFSEKLPANMSAEVWVESQPISAGMSWRPPTYTKIRLVVEAGARDFTYLQTYFRYSCDRVHWSTWYNLQSAKSEANVATVYEGELSIPRMVQEPYYAKMQEWWKTNPVWSSDEHELCVWITSQDPEFFSRQFPFIGYVQVRLEGETRGLQLKSLSVKVSGAVSGLHTLSKGPTRSTTGERWFFDVSKIR